MPLSGKFGVINGQEAVVDWSINDSHTPAESIASNTGNGVDRVKGINSWDGSFNQNIPQPSVLAGDKFAFAGYTAPDDGVSGAGVTYTGTALITQTAINWDFAGGAVLNAAQTFVGHLGLTAGSATHTDDSVSNPYSICGCKIEHSANGTDWTELPDIATATLNLIVQTNTYVNSSTGCETGVEAGPKDWNASITLDSNLRAAPIPTKGDSLEWRFWIDDTLFYRLKWGIVRDFTGITVDRATGAIIQQTMNIDMDVSDGTELGAVAAPDGSFWHGTTFGP